MGILVGRRLVAMPQVFFACNYFMCASTYFSHTIDQQERSDKVNCMEDQFAGSTENTNLRRFKLKLQSISLPRELSEKLDCSHAREAA